MAEDNNNIRRLITNSQSKSMEIVEKDSTGASLIIFFYRTAPLGSIQELPAESCGEIKASEGNNMATREYWIYSDGTAGQAILARCEGTIFV